MGQMTWADALLAFLVSHAAGDILLQTDWQAQNKAKGLVEGGPSRRALSHHIGGYMTAFLPPLFRVGRERGVRRMAIVAGLVAIPHVAVDDGSLVRLWLHRVKRSSDPPTALVIAVDQTFHVLSLLGAAVVATS